MEDVSRCDRCLYTVDHPFGLVVDSSGVCSGCRLHEEKDLLDWESRWDRLRQLIKPYRSRTGSAYDCVIPVSGSGDSFYVVHLVKNKLGLNPLTVTYNHHFGTPVGWRNLSRLREAFDVPLHVKTVDPTVVRRIVRSTLIQLGSVYWHAIAGQTALPVQIAVQKRIPLVIWGAHQGLEQVGMFSHLDEVEMSRRNRKEHDLMGVEAKDLLNGHGELTERDVLAFEYPADSDLMAVGTRGIYLGNFVRWDPLAQSHAMAQQFGLEGASLPRTFDPYDHVDSYVYMGLHDHLKQLKCGYSRVTDHATREIRHGRLSRRQGQILAETITKFSTIPWLKMFSDWLGAESAGVLFAAERWRRGFPAGHALDAPRRSAAGTDTDFPPHPDQLLSLGVGRFTRMEESEAFATFLRGMP